MVLARLALLLLNWDWIAGVVWWEIKLVFFGLCSLFFPAVKVQFGKMPKAVAIILRGQTVGVEAFRFVSWCVDAGCEDILVFDDNGVLLDLEATFAADYLHTMHESTPFFSLFRLGSDVAGMCVNQGRIEKTQANALGRIVHVKFISSEHGGRRDLIQACLQPPTTSTAEFVEKLGTPRIDVLLVSGNQFGDFPPLALKTCEFHYVSSPASRAEFCLAMERYSRSEQRMGA